MRTFLPGLAVVLISASISCAIAAPVAPHEDVAIGALPTESVTATLRKTLSPQGRFVVLAPTGTVRIFDTPEKIEEAKKVLSALQNAPSIVSFAINFKIGMQQVTRGVDHGPVDYEIPVPGTYGAPQIIGQGNHVVVVPGQPGNFTTRHAAPGDRVIVNPGYATGGYVTGTEVNVQTTGWEGGKDHKFIGSTAYPRPVAVPVCERVDDPQSLHDWAVKAGAVPASEPMWTTAAAQIVVTPEHADNGLLLNLMPEIVLPAAAAGQPPRRIPLKICATSVLTKRGVPANPEGFPGADADFYRLFFNAAESADGTKVITTVSAAADYLTQGAGQ